MATSNGQPSAALTDRLTGESWRFDFFQAVRLLNQLREPRQAGGPGDGMAAAGTRVEQAAEPVRFRTTASLAFPGSPVPSVAVTGGGPRFSGHGGSPQDEEAAEVPRGSSTTEMEVSFFGVTGPAGVLPASYTRRLLDQLRDGSTILHDFLDLFNQRLVSHWYSAWEKYRVPFAWEAARTSSSRELDRFTLMLFSLMGLGTAQERQRLNVPEETLACCTGHLASSARTAGDLESLLTEVLDVPVAVGQFEGQWLYLHEDDRSRLPDRQLPKGRFCRLGEDFVAGARVRDVQSRFRISPGPLDLAQFNRLLPHGEDCRTLRELTRLYVGPELDFDIQPVLRAEEVPPLRLVTDEDTAPRLGWNTWLGSRSDACPADDVVFDPDRLPA